MKPGEDDSIEVESTVLESLLPDSAYGDWYHNAAFLGLFPFLSFILGKLGGGLSLLFFIIVPAAVFFRTSLRSYRRKIRENISHEFSVKTIENDTETMDWFNVFLSKLWPFLEPSITNIAVDNINPMIPPYLPTFINSAGIDEITLGSKPPRIEHVRIFPKTDDDVVVMDWKFSWSPNDTEDINFKQLKNRVNFRTKIVAKIGNFLKLPIIIENVAFQAEVRIRLRFMASFPHVQTVDVSLLNIPEIDYNCRMLGGDSLFSWEVNSIPGLPHLINDLIQIYAAPMLISPFAYQLNLQQLLSGGNLDDSIGILVITIKNATNIKSQDIIGNTMDPYINIGYLNQKPISKTKIIKNTSEPIWNETKKILIKNLVDPLILSVIDYNDLRKDKQVGTVTFDVASLNTNSSQTNLQYPILINGKSKGYLNFDVIYLPISSGNTLDDGTVESPEVLNTGILKLSIFQAKNFTNSSKVSTFTEFEINGKQAGSTQIIKNQSSPPYNYNKEVIITNKRKSTLKFKVKESSNIVGSDIYSTLTTTIDDLLEAFQSGENWFPLKPIGKIQLGATWKSIDMKDIGETGSGFIDAIGVLRVEIKNSKNLKNLETVGKIDPYIRLLLNGVQRGRTLAKDGTLNPIWNEVFYIPIHSINQVLNLEAMDVEKLAKDRSLGSITLKLSDFIKKSNDSNGFIQFQDKHDRKGLLRFKKKEPRGTVFYNLGFFPVLNVMDQDELKEANEKRLKKKQEAEAEFLKNQNNKSPKGNGKEKETEKEKENKNEKDKKDDQQKEAISLVTKAPKLELSIGEILSYPSGIFAFVASHASLPGSSLYLQVYLDDSSYPFYTSGRIDNKVSKLSDSRDAFIRELEWSKITFRIVKEQNENATSEEFLSELSIPTLTLLKRSYDEPISLPLSSPISSESNSSIEIQTRFTPSEYHINNSESVLNSGNLIVELLSAENLNSADRNGKSDPYVEFQLNSEKIYKSEKIKKTLNPIWNDEKFTIQINARHSDIVSIIVWDWDMGPQDDDLLGKATLDLTKLEPNMSRDVVLPLIHDSKPAGTIKLRLRFETQYVVRLKKTKTSGLDHLTSTFVVPGKVVGGVGDIATGGLKGIAKGGSKLKGAVFGKKKKGEDEAEQDY